MKGFLFVMLLSNLFTGTLNLHRLLSVTGLSIRWGQWVIKPLFSFLAGMLAYRAVWLPWAAAWGLSAPLLQLALGGCLVSLVYLVFLFLSGGLAGLGPGRQSS